MRREPTTNKLYDFEEMRLARLLRQASLAHIRREYLRAGGLLEDAAALVEWAERPNWSNGLLLPFLRHWAAAVNDERAGRFIHAAPAAWIHLAQELAALLESGGALQEYLGTRWRIEAARLPTMKRLLFGAGGASVLGLGGLILGLTAHALLTGAQGGLWPELTHPTRSGLAGALLTLARLMGALMMVEHGGSWLKRAITGKSGAELGVFLPGGHGGLVLLAP